MESGEFAVGVLVGSISSCLLWVFLDWLYSPTTTTPPQDRTSPPNPNAYPIPEDCCHEDW